MEGAFCQLLLGVVVDLGLEILLGDLLLLLVQGHKLAQPLLSLGPLNNKGLELLLLLADLPLQVLKDARVDHTLGSGHIDLLLEVVDVGQGLVVFDRDLLGVVFEFVQALQQHLQVLARVPAFLFAQLPLFVVQQLLEGPDYALELFPFLHLLFGQPRVFLGLLLQQGQLGHRLRVQGPALFGLLADQVL